MSHTGGQLALGLCLGSLALWGCRADEAPAKAGEPFLYAEPFRRVDAPAEAIIDWYFSLVLQLRPAGGWNPQLERAAREVLADGQRSAIREAGVVLGQLPGTEPLRAIQRLQKATASAEHQALLAIGLGEHESAKARALYATACEHPGLTDDPLCGSEPWSGAAERREAPTTLGERVRAYDADVLALVAEAPDTRVEVENALVACVVDSDAAESTRRTCLERLV